MFKFFFENMLKFSILFVAIFIYLSVDIFGDKLFTFVN